MRLMTGSPPLLALLGWLFTALLLLLVVACIAAARGRIPVNHLVGIRLPALLRSAAAWRAGHAAAIAPAASASAVALIGTAIAVAVPGAHAVSIAAFVVGVVWALVRAQRAATAVLRTSGRAPRRG